MIGYVDVMPSIVPLQQAMRNIHMVSNCCSLMDESNVSIAVVENRPMKLTSRLVDPA
jgi:hypothetical protein